MQAARAKALQEATDVRCALRSLALLFRRLCLPVYFAGFTCCPCFPLFIIDRIILQAAKAKDEELKAAQARSAEIELKIKDEEEKAKKQLDEFERRTREQAEKQRQAEAARKKQELGLMQGATEVGRAFFVGVALSASCPAVLSWLVFLV